MHRTMTLVRWKRFIWDPTKLTPPELSLPEKFELRPAVKDEQKSVSEVVISSFTLDPAWSDVFAQLRPRLETQLDASFEVPNLIPLTISHGPRIVGVSLINTELDAENHLITGPCVRIEYRNRGLGTLLLHESLRRLKAEGVDRVLGICKAIAPAAKFLYPKFGSESEDFESEAALSAIA